MQAGRVGSDLRRGRDERSRYSCISDNTAGTVFGTRTHHCRILSTSREESCCHVPLLGEYRVRNGEVTCLGIQRKGRTLSPSALSSKSQAISHPSSPPVINNYTF